MKICFIGAEIGPCMNGAFLKGHVNNIARLSKRLSEKGCIIHIVTNIPSFSQPSYYDKWMDWAEVHYFQIDSRSIQTFGLEFMVKSIRLIRLLNSQEKIDVVNVHSGWPILAALSVYVEKFLRLKTVHTLYSMQKTLFQGLPVKIPHSFSDSLCRTGFIQLEKIVAASKNVKQALLRLGVPSEKVVFIPPLVDFDKFCFDTDYDKIFSELAFSKKSPVVCYIGGLEKSKGLKIMMETMRNIKNVMPNVMFIIVINKPLNFFSRALKNIFQRSNLASNIRLVGATSRINEVLAASDIVVAPYIVTSENYVIADYPLSVLEAMAMGKAVVAFNFGGISDLLTDGRGVVLDQPTARALSAAVLYLINNLKIRKSIANKAFQFIKDNFSEELIVSKTLAMFENCLEPGV